MHTTRFTVYHRPRSIGAGWIRFQTVAAASPADAIDRTFHDGSKFLPSQRPDNLRNDGTPERPLLANGDASECMAVPQTT